MIIYWLAVTIANILPINTFEKYQLNDKLEHYLVYLVLTLFIFFSCVLQKRIAILRTHPFVSAFLFIAFYGMLNELIQLYVPGRFCDVKDWLADVAGALTGIVLLFPFFSKAVKILIHNDDSD